MSGRFFDNETLEIALSMLKDELKEAPEWRKEEARAWFYYCTTRQVKRPKGGSQAPEETTDLVEILVEGSPHPVAADRLREAIDSRPRQSTFKLTAHP